MSWLRKQESDTRPDTVVRGDDIDAAVYRDYDRVIKTVTTAEWDALLKRVARLERRRAV